MSEFLAKTANLALLGLGVLPIIALSVARAEPATVRVSDLDASRPAHVAMFHARVGRVADDLCASRGDGRDLKRLATCRAAVRAEAEDRFASYRRQAQMHGPGAMAMAAR